MLFILLLLPLCTLALIGFGSRPNSNREQIYVALWGSILNWIHTNWIQLLFDPSVGMNQVSGLLGIDGISQWQIWLVNMLQPIIIMSLWHQSQLRMMLIFVIQVVFWSIAVFMVLDIQQFYISFEGSLIPMYFQIIYFGSRNKKIHASQSFMLFTLTGSLFLFLAILSLWIQYGTTNYQLIRTQSPSGSDEIQQYCYQAFLIAFIIKLPLVPFHTWLIVTHTESPTVGSVIQAAIQQKMGSYGQIRYCIPLFPSAHLLLQPLILCQCVISIIYTSIAAISQIDIKQIIAYSSIGHQATATQGMYSNEQEGLIGSVYFQISHGQISSALFLLVGVLYDRYHTRTILYYRGQVQIYPIFVTLLMLFSMANSGLPGTSGFVGEFLSLLGLFHLNPFLTLLAGLSVIFVPAFMLPMQHRISYGSFSPYIITITNDLTRKEMNMFLPLQFGTLIQGFLPQILLDSLITSCISLLY